MIPRVSAVLDNPLHCEFHADHGTRVVVVHTTGESGLRVGAAMDHEIDGSSDVKVQVESQAYTDGGVVTATALLKPGQRLRMVKYVAYGWSGSRTLPAVRDQVWAALSAAKQSGWDGLLAEQREYLDDFWDRADVEVDGDTEVQQAVRFALFHVLQAGARAETRAIPAKGLTGPGYDGHAFWDTETFVLPVLSLTSPAAAANALRWRHSTLPAGYRAGVPARPEGRGLPVADHRRRGVLGLLARRHGRLPRQCGHRRRGGPLRRPDRGRGLRPGTGDGTADPHRAAVAFPRPPRRPGAVPHRRGHRPGRVQRPGRQQHLHQPDGPARTWWRPRTRRSAIPDRARELGVDPEESAGWRDAAEAMFIPYDEARGRPPAGRGVHPPPGLGFRPHHPGAVPAAAALHLLRPVPQAGRQAGRPGAGHASVRRRLHRRAEGRGTSTTTSR